jgi:hypothetical protein
LTAAEELMKITPKTNFLIKSILAGIIGGKALSFYWGFASDTQPGLFTAHFQEFFGFILVFWLVLGDNFKIKDWLFAGIVGSAVYALFLVYLKLPPYPIHNKFSISTIAFIEWTASHAFAAILGSIPQWIVMRRKLSKAYTWIVVNAFWYGLLAVYSYVQIVTTVYLLDGKLGENSSWFYLWVLRLSGDPTTMSLGYLMGYGLFGLMLGYALFNIIQHKDAAIKNAVSN